MRTFSGSIPITLDCSFRLSVPERAADSSRVPLVVALHGFGESGERFAARLSGLGDGSFAVAYPDAPYPVEMREGDAKKPSRVGHAWYQYTGDANAFVAALEFVGRHVDRLIAKLVDEFHVDPHHVVLLGYSQGGYLAAAHALAHPSRFAGLVAIATRIKAEMFSDEHLKSVGFPVLAIHGRRDTHVPIEGQRSSVARLIESGVRVEWKEHDGGHGLRAESVPTIHSFVARIP